ncbi:MULTISPECIES: PepSY domain-containing protein [unclassified Cellulophaga]|uniref:PepSY domain-containing protein n=1 Tax=unclassified Cellulophaga TaxID=2634405 RepID=UPI0026E213CD|nr:MULTISPECIES: PepSY domain-containing protein [unclassified Cellulophaga]MDO6490644.1 PepSY domain-containing protein [Cellulophaga sp. 2_MG-2023]MDO6494162.1 PepSY domain-containing protein [Cellulophaga sp. 3_MG-2023]
MTLSVWRYSHLVLAVSSSIFILLAAVTGSVLALEPISNRIQPYTTGDLDQVTVAEFTSTLQQKYAEVISVEIDKNSWVTASVIDKDGTDKIIYIDPKTGDSLGTPKESSAVFKFATTLHRSLFLKGIGRFFVGLSSLLLCLISISGIFLILKKQGGVTGFFKPIVKENFNPYYHTLFGKWLLIPILVITLTGVYLSLEQFSVLPSAKIVHQEDTLFAEEPVIPVADFKVFKDTKLSQVRKIEYPFAPFPESYFLLQLTDKEYLVNQFNGDIVSQVNYPFYVILTYYSTLFHTGQGSIVWSIVLLLASIGILFFMYSGFSITLQRRKSRIKNKYKKDDCDYVILIGSENGNTFYFANALYSELLRLGKKAYLAELNSYKSYKNMQHLVVMTSTYGTGEAPTNAKKFKALLNTHQQGAKFNYSVVGFGSLAYPDYCKFAYDVDTMLQAHPNNNRLADVFTINNQSLESFNQWLLAWSKQENLNISLPKAIGGKKKRKTYTFTVTKHTKAENNPDDTFCIYLKPVEKVKFTSGDLLSILGEKDQRERLYSIGKWEKNELVISVKRHQKGSVSNRLQNLAVGNKISCGIVKNKAFHLPKKAKEALLIATGTGIGPYLGMIRQNTAHKKLHLYWGGRTAASFELYKNQLEEQQQAGKLTSLHLALSREQAQKVYVQNLLEANGKEVAQLINNKGYILICGSIGMQKEVTTVLDTICKNHLKKPLSYYQNKGHILMDCY